MNTQEKLTAFYEWCRKCNIDVGSNERMLDAYQRIADNVKKITMLLLLTCTTAFADPPEDMPDKAQCPWCDEDEESELPIDDYLLLAGGAAIALGGFIKLKN